VSYPLAWVENSHVAIVEEKGPSGATLVSMSPEERVRMNDICTRLQVEQDHNKFTQLMSELNNLLERKEHRLQESDKERVSVEE
jgi:hypothetical protein